MSYVLDVVLWLVQTAIAAMISVAIKLGVDEYFKMLRMYPIC